LLDRNSRKRVTDCLLFGPTLHDVVKLLIRQGEFPRQTKQVLMRDHAVRDQLVPDTASSMTSSLGLATFRRSTDRPDIIFQTDPRGGCARRGDQALRGRPSSRQAVCQSS
jgi:hypothetical protein